MPSSVKCIAIDIDGTLIPEYSFRNGEISEKNIGAIKVFCNSGGKIILSTGRSLRRTKHVFDFLIKQGISPESIPYLICWNGAIVLDTATNDHAFAPNFFNKNVCLQMKKWLTEKKFNFFFVNSKNEIFFKKSIFSSFVYTFGFKKSLTRMPLEALTDFTDIQKIMIFFKWPVANRARKEFLKTENKDCYCSVAHKYFMEIVDNKIDKFFAIQKISELLKIPISSFAAMGNEQNDVMSLENVGFGCGVDLEKKGKMLKCNLEKILFKTVNKKKDGVARAIKFLKDEGYF